MNLVLLLLANAQWDLYGSWAYGITDHNRYVLSPKTGNVDLVAEVTRAATDDVSVTARGQILLQGGEMLHPLLAAHVSWRGLSAGRFAHAFGRVGDRLFDPMVHRFFAPAQGLYTQFLRQGIDGLRYTNSGVQVFAGAGPLLGARWQGPWLGVSLLATEEEMSAGLDTEWVLGRWWVRAEGAVQRREHTAADVVLELGYLVLPALEAVARFDWLDRLPRVQPRLAHHHQEVAIGANLRPAGPIVFRLSYHNVVGNRLTLAGVEPRTHLVALSVGWSTHGLVPGVETL
jgi:hypothetical protein